MELYALLYSFSQDCYHVEPLEETLQMNWEAMQTDERNDYLLVGIGKTREEMIEWESQMKIRFPKRGHGKNPGNMKFSEFE